MRTITRSVKKAIRSAVAHAMRSKELREPLLGNTGARAPTPVVSSHTAVLNIPTTPAGISPLNPLAHLSPRINSLSSLAPPPSSLPATPPSTATSKTPPHIPFNDPNFVVGVAGGTGDLPQDIIVGLVLEGFKGRIIISGRTKKRAKEAAEKLTNEIAEKYGVPYKDPRPIEYVASNAELPALSNMVLLGVKPVDMEAVLDDDMCQSLNEHPNVLLGSLGASKTTDFIRARLGQNKTSIPRIVTTRAARYGCATTFLYDDPTLPLEHRQLITDFSKTIGEVFWVTEEHMLDTAVAVACYTGFLLGEMEACKEQLVAAGISPEDAQKALAQTQIGAGRIAKAETLKSAILRVGKPRVSLTYAQMEGLRGTAFADMAQAFENVRLACARANEVPNTKPPFVPPAPAFGEAADK